LSHSGHAKSRKSHSVAHATKKFAIISAMTGNRKTILILSAAVALLLLALASCVKY
jgi:DNA-binding transcriptional regulator LsrR (DeoR family)